MPPPNAGGAAGGADEGASAPKPCARSWSSNRVRSGSSNRGRSGSSNRGCSAPSNRLRSWSAKRAVVLRPVVVVLRCLLRRLRAGRSPVHPRLRNGRATPDVPPGRWGGRPGWPWVPKHWRRPGRRHRTPRRRQPAPRRDRRSRTRVRVAGRAAPGRPATAAAPPRPMPLPHGRVTAARRAHRTGPAGRSRPAVRRPGWPRGRAVPAAGAAPRWPARCRVPAPAGRSAGPRCVEAPSRPRRAGRRTRDAPTPARVPTARRPARPGARHPPAAAGCGHRRHRPRRAGRPARPPTRTPARAAPASPRSPRPPGGPPGRVRRRRPGKPGLRRRPLLARCRVVLVRLRRCGSVRRPARHRGRAARGGPPNGPWRARPVPPTVAAGRPRWTSPRHPGRWSTTPERPGGHRSPAVATPPGSRAPAWPVVRAPRPGRRSGASRRGGPAHRRPNRRSCPARPGGRPASHLAPGRSRPGRRPASRCPGGCRPGRPASHRHRSLRPAAARARCPSR